MAKINLIKTLFVEVSLVATLLLICACSKQRESKIQVWKQEIVDTEHSFCEMAENEGIPKAFIYYAADSAVLLRGNKLIMGKEAIQTYFNTASSNNYTLTWKPDFVDVSASGDLGYTYGKYLFSMSDSLGKLHTDSGIFHTVWKRQADGTWRFVWD